MSKISNCSVTDNMKQDRAKLKVVGSSPENPLVVSDEQLIRLLKDANKKLGDHARLLTRQRDDLLAALEYVISDLELRASLKEDDERGEVDIGDGCYRQALDAIASVKGGA